MNYDEVEEILNKDVEGTYFKLKDFKNNENLEGAIQWVIEQTSCDYKTAHEVVSAFFAIPVEKYQPKRTKLWCPNCLSESIATVNETSLIGTGAPINICQVCGYKWKPGRSF